MTERLFKRNTHKQKDGVVIKISDMSDSHLLNTARLLYRKSKEGVVAMYGGGLCSEDMWYDEEILYGEEALSKLNFDAYKHECRRRWLSCNFEWEKAA